MALSHYVWLKVNKYCDSEFLCDSLGKDTTCIFKNALLINVII